MKNVIAALALSAVCLSAPMAQAQTREERAAERAEKKKLGSLYLRCDGEPNNMTDGESFARFLGAITLLGIFAPARESPDPSKRLFGEEGVDACSQLIDGEKAEGNTVRRIPLILARALHHIEAKNYQAALDDVEKARAEAVEAELAGNPYFDRSMGLSFNRIASTAHLRMGNPELARDASVQSIAQMKYSFVPNAFTIDYGEFLRDFSEAEEARFATEAKIMPGSLFPYSTRLMEVGRFADAADVREAYITYYETLDVEDVSSEYYAVAAVAHALAGNWDRAAERSAFARKNLDDRVAQGKPETRAAYIVELLDFYDVLKHAHNGDMALARRLFTGRSQWTSPRFGAVMAAIDLLREGASEEELIGSLSRTSEEMWQKRYDDKLAVELQSDTDNETLFDLIVSYAKVDEFEDRSRNTHRVEKSKLMNKEQEEDGTWRIVAYGSPYSSIDSIVLHAALQAKAKGKEGFTMSLVLPRSAGFAVGFARFMDRGEDKAGDILFVPADEVIAELSQVIPTREELRLRKNKRKRNR